MCEQCYNGHGKVDAAGTGCVVCSDRLCDRCDVDPLVCTSCMPGYDNQGYGLGPSGACVPCSDPLCSACGTNASTCEPGGCQPFAAPGADGVCSTCEMKLMTSDFTGMSNVVLAPLLSAQAVPDRCAPLDAWAIPAAVLPNGTVTGACYPEANVPLPITAAFSNISRAVLDQFVATGGNGTVLCGGQAPAAAVPGAPIALCASGFMKSGYYNFDFDARFEALVTCQAGRAPVLVALRGLLHTNNDWASPSEGNNTVAFATLLGAQPPRS